MSGTSGIIGYRELTEEEKALINQCKEMANKVGLLCSVVKATPGVDQRWVSIAITDLQKGFMSLIRGIAQPTSF